MSHHRPTFRSTPTGARNGEAVVLDAHPSWHRERVATTLAAGALAMALTASGTAALSGASTNTPVGALAIALTASGSPFQPLLDQLSQAQQAVIAHNTQYPFVTDFDKTLLPSYVQWLAQYGAYNGLSELNLSKPYDMNANVLPYLFNAPLADPHGVVNTPNPDDVYNLSHVGDQTQVITITPGPGTEDTTFTLMAGDGVHDDFASIRAYDLSQFTPNPDGTYTILVSPTEQSGNWINTAGGETLLTRDTVGDWGLPHDNISFQVGENQPFVMPVLSNDEIASILASDASTLEAANLTETTFGLQYAENALIPDNTFSIIRNTTATIGGPILPGQLSSIGHYSLEPDQALIVKVPDLASGYSAIQLNNAWTQDLPYATAQGSLNNTDTFHGTDGFTYYVVSDQDPGVANWVDNSGLPDGNIFLRWQDVTGAIPQTPVTAEVVDIADVSKYLPADMPTVTAAERAADLQERLFEYDYRQDQLHDPGWVTSNLEWDQIKAAVGTDQYNQLFGGQNDVPSVLDRLTTPALTPDFGTLTQDILANPSGSLSAIINNLPLAMKDIELPVVLAALRLEEAIGSGMGLQGLGAIFDQTFADPATSITAGFLNARDDLAVSLAHGDSYTLAAGDFTSAWDQLSQLDQSVSEMLSAGFSYMVGGLAP